MSSIKSTVKNFIMNGVIYFAEFNSNGVVFNTNAPYTNSYFIKNNEMMVNGEHHYEIYDNCSDAMSVIEDKNSVYFVDDAGAVYSYNQKTCRTNYPLSMPEFEVRIVEHGTYQTIVFVAPEELDMEDEVNSQVWKSGKALAYALDH